MQERDHARKFPSGPRSKISFKTDPASGYDFGFRFILVLSAFPRERNPERGGGFGRRQHQNDWRAVDFFGADQPRAREYLLRNPSKKNRGSWTAWQATNLY